MIWGDFASDTVIAASQQNLFLEYKKKFETKNLVYRTRAAACPEPVGLIIK